MKKIIFIFTILYSLNAFAYYTENISDQCGVVGDKLFAVFTPTVYACSNGYYLPANTDSCQICAHGHSCPGGTYTFNETEDQGLTIGTYICNSGYFLPANSDMCATCPTDYTCNGGTYSFNENEFQGATKSSTYITNNLTNMCATNAAHDLFAYFEPNQHTCLPGYYLPAGVDDCTICPVANKCVGGTYTFNEAETQGIEPCPSGTFSPGGTAYCYEHILHVGEDVVYLKSDKLTTPSLNVGMDDGIFYANMTTIPTFMNKDSEHYLKIKYDNTIYYVCDDTMCGE